jgi:hypothetical protein
MYVTSSRGSQAANSKANFRDKRYGVPKLLVDLLSGERETRLWSTSQMILRDAPEDLQAAEAFTGAFSLEDRPAVGLFEARIAKRDAARRVIGAEFAWISPAGRELLGGALAARQADSQDQLPALRVSITQQTVNWSLTGMLLERYQGKLEPGQPFRGMIRLEKAEEPGPFGATVIRVDGERRTLALKFQDLPGDTFGLLEAAIKKSGAS